MKAWLTIIMTNVELIEDEDRYYNWYHGYTELKLPYIKDATGEISYQVTTTAISGNMSTQYFGNKFDADKVDIRFNPIMIRVDPPETVISDPEVTLNLDIQKIEMKDLSIGYDKFLLNFKDITGNQTHMITSYTPPEFSPSRSRYKYKEMRLSRRNMIMEDVRKQKLAMMPGFRFMWFYSGKEVKPWTKYSKDDITKAFIRNSSII